MIVEESRCINIGYLIKQKILQADSLYIGSLQWSIKGSDMKNSISIRIKTNETSGILTLDYTYNQNTPICYEVELITKPSNLGFGLVWYFVCPKTKKVCRKLHFVGGYFFHRTAFKGFYYQQQTQCRKNRKYYSRVFDDAFREKWANDYYKPYLKHHYKGKPTKTILRLQKRYEKVEKIDFENYFYT